MKNLIFNSILIVVLLFSGSCKKEDTCVTLDLEQETIFNTEEYLILESIIDSFYTDFSFLHINQNAGVSSYTVISEYVDVGFIAFDTTSIIPNQLDADSVYTWGNLFSSEMNLINPEELLCFFSENGDGWEGYYSKYEDSSGYFNFRRPLINENDEAVITYAKYCGGLCAYGYIATLNKVDGEWKVEENILVWVS